MDAKLNVETAKTTIGQRETVKEQQSLLLPMPEGRKPIQSPWIVSDSVAPTVVTDNTANKETPRSLGSPVMTKEYKVKRVLPAQGVVGDQCTADNIACQRRGVP